MKHRILTIGLIYCSLVFLTSCKEELQLPDNVIEFEAAELGISSEESDLTINISFSREASEDAALVLAFETEGVLYGTDFFTDPQADANAITLNVVKGAASTSFKVAKVEGALFDGDESITFTIQSSTSQVLGEKSSVKLTFAEIVSSGAVMDPNVGGEQQPNKVFVDLSANRQTAVSRSDWDLGFYTAEGEFKVILNSSSAMLARPLDKTDMNNVTVADTTGWGAQLAVDAIFAAVLGPPPAWISETESWIDAPEGNLSSTAIASVSATDADNKVYIINRGENADGSQRGWKKVRILRNGTGYAVQHAEISATTFQTIAVTRDTTYLFNYINFDSGVVPVEPPKDQWDIAFTVFTNTTPLGGPGAPVIPYVFLDVVLQNRYEVETSSVLISDVAYENFSEANISALTFGASQVNIGSGWRTGGGPGSTPTLSTDHFYIVQDADDNVYKLRFTALTQNGERGRPQIEYALVKRGM